MGELFDRLASGEQEPEEIAPASSSRLERLAEQRQRSGETTYDQARRRFSGFREPNFVERIGRGMVDVIDGVKSAYYDLTDEDKARDFRKKADEELGIYESNAGDGFDVGRLVGQAAATSPLALLPGGQAGLLGRTVSGAVQGGLAGGSLYVKEGESRTGNVVGGLLGGAAVPPAIAGAARLGGKLAGAGQRVKGLLTLPAHAMAQMQDALAGVGVNFGALAPNLQDGLRQAAREQLNTSGVIDPEALARMAKYEELGFVGDAGPMMGQVTRSPQQWANERNLGKLDDESGAMITGRLENQKRRFAQIKNEVIGEIPSVEGIESADVVIDAIKGRWKTTQEAVGALYKAVREEVGDQAGVTVEGLLQRLDAESVNAPAGDIVKSINGKLAQIGYEEKGSLTIGQAEELRKWVGQLADGNEPNLQRLKREFVDLLDDDVIDSVGIDAFKEARSAARKRFQEFSTKLVKGIVDEKMEPQRLMSAIRNASPKNLQSLKENLLDAPDGMAAWERLRQQVVTDIWEKAQKHGEMSEFSGARFKDAMKGYQTSRLKVLFEPEELDHLLKVKDAGMGMTFTPPYSAVNWSNTTPTIYNMLKQSREIPLIGGYLQSAGERGAKAAEVDRALTGAAVDPGLLKGYEDLVTKGLLTKLYPVSKTAPIAAGLLAPELLN